MCLCALLALLAAGCRRSATVGELNIVPEPLFSVQKEGTFTLSNTPKLSVVGLGQNSPAVKYIMQAMRHAHLHPRLVPSSAHSDIEFSVYDTVNPELGDEGYLIEVRSDGISLRANGEAGLFYAFQTLVQMLPPDMTEVNYRTVVLPECTVLDRPRFAWRGVQLDAAHLSFSSKEIRRWVDVMAMYKMNRLHLTFNFDDENFDSDELAQLLGYASDRHVRVVPELCDTADTDSLLRFFGFAEGELPVLCRTHRGALDSARADMHVVFSPDECFDLARYQADPRYQPAATVGLATLERVYAFEPAPVGTNTHVVANLKGGMCRLGTELIASTQQAEYMLLPRMLAVSECLWSQPARRDWMRFRRKVEEQKERLDVKGYAYCDGSFTPQFTVRRVDDEMVNISITTEVPNTYIFYTTDLGTPTRQSSIYLGPVNLRRGTHIKILPVYKDQERDSVYEYIIK